MSVTSVLLSLALAAAQPDASAAGGSPETTSTAPGPLPPPSPPTPTPVAPATDETTAALPPPPPPVDPGPAIQAAYESAESAQGPLDGRWRLSGTDGADLFALVMADTGGAPSSRATSPDNPAIEGAWRDLRRPGAVGALGLLQSVTHIADSVEIRFYEADPSTPTVIRLRAEAGGGWSGDLVETGASRPVVMKRF